MQKVKMSKEKTVSTLYSELGPHVYFPNSKLVCSSALYLCYCDMSGKKDASLYRRAFENINKDNISKNIYDIVKENTKKYGNKEFVANALVFSSNPFIDYRFNNSNNYLSDLILKILDVQEAEELCDFGSGSGAFLSYAASKYNELMLRPLLKGIEISTDDAFISKMILEICGAKYDINNSNFLTMSVDPKKDLFDKGYVFPPLGLKYAQEGYRINNPELKKLINSRTSSEWLFVLKALENMRENGRLIALMPENVLFKSPDTSIRKYLLENNLIEGIITLPNNAFDENNVKMSLIVISRNNKTFKYVNGVELLSDLPIKGLKSDEASTYLKTEFFRDDVEKYDINNVEKTNYSLTLNAIIKEKVDESLPELQFVSEVIRGCNLTLANFKDDIFEGDSAYQILTSSDIGETGFIDLDKLIHIGGDKKYDKFTVQKGDIVITTKSTKVKVAVINEEPKRKIIVTGAMIIIRPHQDKLNGTFLKLYLDSEKGRKALSSIQKGSIIVTVSIDNLAKMRMNLPSLSEQERIVEEYNKLNDKREKAIKLLENIDQEITNYTKLNIK